MKLLLTSAAAALMVTSFGASAADLAKKAPVAVDYVKVCDAYGAGFFYIPGSDTCLKIGGYLRAQVVAGDDDFDGYVFGGARSDSNFVTLGRLQLQVDARSMTSYGVLRSFGAVNVDMDAGTKVTKVDQAYIQFAGFTAGYAQSFFDYFTGYAPAVSFGEVAHDDKANLIAYTFGFASGVTATLSVEDSVSLNAGREGAANYGGNKAPDVVGNVKIEQGWGTAQVMGVAHNAYGNATFNNVDKWGYAVGGGVTLKLPMLGADDEFGIQAVYADGAIRYLTLGDSDNSYDFNDNSGDVAKGWSVFAGLKHGFAPNLVGAVQGGYVKFDSYIAGDDFNRWDATASLTWTPVTNLELTAFVEYRTQEFDSAALADRDGLVGGLRMQRNF